MSLDRHFGNIDGLLFDQVLLVDKSQAPWFDKFVRELSVEQNTTLLDTARGPLLKS